MQKSHEKAVRETPSVLLRSLEIEDAERIYKWHNDANLYDSLLSPFRCVSLAVVEEWLRKKQSYSNQEINWAIYLTTNSQHIGNIYLRNIDWISRHGELNIFIGDVEQRAKGYGKAAVRLLIEYALKDLGLQRLYLFVLKDNMSAIKMYEKCGFIKEGELRGHIFKDSQFKDVLIMGLCAGDVLTRNC